MIKVFQPHYTSIKYSQVTMESDRDVQEALTAFVDAAKQQTDVKYCTIHVKECVVILLQRSNRAEPLEPKQCSSKPSQSRKRSRTSASTQSTKRSKKVLLLLITISD